MNELFWNEQFLKAYNLRQSIDIVKNAQTNCYRLINAEGDGFSGLIVDIYGSAAVVQCHTVGMYKNIKSISTAIQKIYGSGVDTIYDKNKLSSDYGHRFILGTKEEAVVSENGLNFKVNWVHGQKTGFFLDQRMNRKLLGTYIKGKSVLNTFCYTGGFSVYAQGAGATKVDSIDASSTAIGLTTENMDINKISHDCERTEVVADVMDYLKESTTEYDILIVDPPAFAKSQRKRHNAVQAYKRLNVSAFKRVKPGGLIFTFSCSQVVSRSLFTDTIRAAAIESGRSIQIIHYLSQPADHPSNIYHPEGSYLKGLVLKIT